MKKKLIALVTALTLCAVVVVGGTLAYYSQQTDTVKNSFTYDPSGQDPDPEIIEPHFPKDPSITPGTATPKDPQIQLTNDEAEGEFYAAMVIEGSSPAEVAGIKVLKDILADGTDGTFKLKVPVIDGSTGEQAKDKDGKEIWETKEYTKDKGLAKIFGWNTTDYRFEVNADGNVYAYYRYTLSNTASANTNPTMATTPNVATPVFTAVVTNTNLWHVFFDADGKEIEYETDVLYDISVKGYVVSSLNDTKITGYGADGKTPQYATWGTSELAMKTAFADQFAGGTAKNPPYVAPATNPLP